MRFFFYGTLMDPDICRLVLGARAESLRARPAVLTGYRRVRASHGDFPILLRRSGGRVRGQLVEGLGAGVLPAIALFEGREYEPRRALVIDGSGRRVAAWMFVPGHGRWATARAWNLARWRQRHKSRLIPQLRLWLLDQGIDRLHSVDVPWRVRRWVRRMMAESE